MKNQHPVVMFELLSSNPDRLRNFYQRVFGWHFDVGSDSFGFVNFDDPPPSTLGGIGRSDGRSGYTAGAYFYLSTSDVAGRLKTAEQNGAKVVLEATTKDDSTFGMFQDPDGNTIGLLQQVESTSLAHKDD